MRSADIAARCREIALAVKHSGEWGELHETLEAVAVEIESLREAIRRLADQDATLSVCDGRVIVTMDGTLTDEEQAAVTWAIDQLLSMPVTKDREAADTLRSMLERLGGPNG